MLRRSLCQAVVASNRKRLTVVLDMDECLIHSANFTMPSDLRQYEASRPSQVIPRDGVESFKLTMDDGMQCQVFKRSGLHEFLESCAKEFDTFIFTAGTQEYAEPLLDIIDPTGELLKGRYYRHNCRRVSFDGHTQFLKDLTAVTSELHNCVLVDNNPISFVCQPRNGIPVPDFIGEPDSALPAVLKLLRELQLLPDVRPRLHELFDMEPQLTGLRSTLLGDSKL